MTSGVEQTKISLLFPEAALKPGDPATLKSLKLDFSPTNGFEASILCFNKDIENLVPTQVEAHSRKLNEFKDRIRELPQNQVTALFLSTFALEFQQQSNNSFTLIVNDHPSILPKIETSFGQDPLKVLNEKLLVNERFLITQLAEAVSKDPSLEKTLFGLIEQSKTDPAVAIAAANAITILNSAGVSFSNRNFKGVRIPGADLSHAILFNADLSHADLTNVKMHDPYLVGTSLAFSQLSGIQLGQRPCINYGAPIIAFNISPDGTSVSVVLETSLAKMSKEQMELALKDLRNLFSGQVKIFYRENKSVSSWQKSFVYFENSTSDELFTTDDSNPLRVRLSSDGRSALFTNQEKIYFKDIFEKKELILEGHQKWITGLALSPDSKQALSGSADQTIKLWDLATGKELLSLPTPDLAAFEFGFSSDGEKAFAISSIESRKTGRYAITFWDLKTGKELYSLKSKIEIQGTFSQNGNQALLGNDEIQLIDLVSGKVLLHISSEMLGINHYSPIKALALSPNGKQALILYGLKQNNKICLWDLSINKKLMELHSHERRVAGVAFSQDGQWIHTSSKNGTTQIWDITRQNIIKLTELDLIPTTYDDKCFALSHDGKRAIFGRWPLVDIIEINSGKKLLTLKAEKQNPIASPNNATFSADDRLAIVYREHDPNNESPISVWDLNTQKEIYKKLEFGNDYIHVSPNSEWLLLSSLVQTSYDSGFYYFERIDIRSGERLNLPILQAPSCIALSFDGNWVLSGNTKGVVSLWDLNQKRDYSDLEARAVSTNFEGHTKKVLSVTFSPDGKLALSGGEDKDIYFWDLTTGKKIHSLKGHSGAVTALLFSHHQQYALSGSIDNTVRLWDLKTGQVLYSFSHDQAITRIQFQEESRGFTAYTKSKMHQWQVFDEEGKLAPSLLWNSHPAFTVNRIDLTGAVGLSEANQRLLEQVGNIHEIESNQDDEKKSPY